MHYNCQKIKHSCIPNSCLSSILTCYQEPIAYPHWLIQIPSHAPPSFFKIPQPKNWMTPIT